jgi:hypothetical protein
VLTFLILGIAIIWCHYFTKLTCVGGKCTTCSLYFVHFYLLFYSSYIFRRSLRMTWQMTSSTTSSISPEEARSVAILGTTPEEEARLTVILGTTKLWSLDLYVYMDLWSYLWMFMLCMDVMNIVKFEWMCWILWCLNECVYECSIYCLCKLCRIFNSSCADYTVFYKKKL